MSLGPSWIFSLLQCRDRLKTSKSDVYRRQILTTKVDPSAVSMVRVIWFQVNFKAYKTKLKLTIIVCGRCSDNQIIQFLRCLFLINRNIFFYLKLEFALAILALNERKIETNNSAAQGLKIACNDSKADVGTQNGRTFDATGANAICQYPANTTHQPNVWPMLGQRRRHNTSTQCLANVGPTS